MAILTENVVLLGFAQSHDIYPVKDAINRLEEADTLH